MVRQAPGREGRVLSSEVPGPGGLLSLTRLAPVPGHAGASLGPHPLATAGSQGLLAGGRGLGVA